MSSAPTTNVTQLLLDWRAGKQEALDRLMPVVYDERLAKACLNRELKNNAE